MSGAGQAAPEAPQVVLRGLLIGGGGETVDLVVAGVQSGHDAANRAALAGGVRPLEQQDRGDPAPPRFQLLDVELLLFDPKDLLVSLLLQAHLHRQL